MDIRLTPVEARIIGVLMEKEMSTPDYYPLSLKALTAGCNQKSNREPVTNLGEREIQEAVNELRSRRLVRQVRRQGGRAEKFEHDLKDPAKFLPLLTKEEMALLSLLLLRGEQTPGELRNRSARLCEFPSTAAVERHLGLLAEKETGPAVEKLVRRPGQKENRWRQLLCAGDGINAISAPDSADIPDAGPSAGIDGNAGLAARVAELESGVVRLTGRMERLEALWTKLAE